MEPPDSAEPPDLAETPPQSSPTSDHATQSSAPARPHPDPQETRDHADQMDRPETPEHQETMDGQERLDPRDHPASPDSQETLDPRDLPAPQESSVPPHLHHLVAQDSPDAQELQEPQERVDVQETMEPQETQEVRATRDVQDSQDALGTPDPQGSQETQEPQEAATTAHQPVWPLDIKPSSSSHDCDHTRNEEENNRMKFDFEHSNFAVLLGLCALNFISSSYNNKELI